LFTANKEKRSSAMKLQIIQLEPYDDVISVRDRLSFVNTERVLLIWPRAGKILKRKLDLVLIQRETARRGARLALVTDDLDVIDNAQELNISTFDTVKASYRAVWKRPVKAVFVDRSDRPEDAPDAYELRLTASRLRPLTPEQQHFQRVARIVAASVLGLVLFLVLYLFGPAADVVIYPAQTQINTTIKLVADPSITTVDVESGHVPAVLVVIEVSSQASIPTTGSSNVPNTLASGIVLFTNQTDNPVFIPSGTVVSTFGLQPAKFRTTSDLNVDAGNGRSAQVTVEALPDSAGPAGNVSANLITVIEGTLSTSLSVRNEQPTLGGTIRQTGVVTKQDYDNLLLLAREKLRQTSLGQFSARLSGTQFIAPDSIKVIEEHPEWNSYSAFVGDHVDTLTLDMRAKVQALVIDEQLARQAALASLSAKIPIGQQVSPDSVTFTRGAIQPSSGKDQVTFFMSASGNVAVEVNADRVRQRLLGMNVSDAEQALERELLLDPRRPPQITVYPGLWRQLPVLPLRINVTVNAAK
jgi:hypothetical protein